MIMPTLYRIGRAVGNLPWWVLLLIGAAIPFALPWVVRLLARRNTNNHFKAAEEARNHGLKTPEPDQLDKEFEMQDREINAPAPVMPRTRWRDKWSSKAPWLLFMLWCSPVQATPDNCRPMSDFIEIYQDDAPPPPGFGYWVDADGRYLCMCTPLKHYGDLTRIPLGCAAKKQVVGFTLELYDQTVVVFMDLKSKVDKLETVLVDTRLKLKQTSATATEAIKKLDDAGAALSVCAEDVEEASAGSGGWDTLRVAGGILVGLAAGYFLL